MHISNAGNNANIKTFPIKIKILLAYLEKILYLWAVGECGGKEKKLALGKRRAQNTVVGNKI